MDDDDDYSDDDGSFYSRDDPYRHAATKPIGLSPRDKRHLGQGGNQIFFNDNMPDDDDYSDDDGSFYSRDGEEKDLSNDDDKCGKGFKLNQGGICERLSKLGRGIFRFRGGTKRKRKSSKRKSRKRKSSKRKSRKRKSRKRKYRKRRGRK
jgi:hypothetical protein